MKLMKKSGKGVSRLENSLFRGIQQVQMVSLSGRKPFRMAVIRVSGIQTSENPSLLCRCKNP